MNHQKLICLLLFYSVLFGSGGFDNGTATGKGKFQLDLTWNPFDNIKYGQTYGILSYGITDNFDFHGYFSRHSEPYYTWYFGLFYQFFKSDKIHLATATGIRKRVDKEWTHIFSPQLLFTTIITDKLTLGGSIVNVYDYDSKNNIGVAVDLALGYKINVKSKKIDSITINIGGFHPVTHDELKTYFLPTYSIDFRFN